MKKYNTIIIAIGIWFLLKLLLILFYCFNWVSLRFTIIQWVPEIFFSLFILYKKLTGGFVNEDAPSKKKITLGMTGIALFAIYCLTLYFYGDMHKFPTRVLFGAFIFAGLLILIELRSRIKK